MIQIKKLRIYILLLFTFVFTSINAQIDFDPGGDIDEVPINGLVIVGLIAGAALGLRKTKK
jgi:hypothetical protein